MEFEGGKKIDMRVDIAPLVDIVFLLLLFFLLTSQFIKQPGMKVELPRAQEARAQDLQDIVVAVTRDERYFLNGEAMKLEELKDRLCFRIENNERKIVIIKADRRVALQPVVTVMDFAKQCGAKGVTISTKLKEAAGTEQ
ncbi:MAG: biopolymer transporter ExbD [bacterium]